MRAEELDIKSEISSIQKDVISFRQSVMEMRSIPRSKFGKDYDRDSQMSRKAADKDGNQDNFTKRSRLSNGTNNEFERSDSLKSKFRNNNIQVTNLHSNNSNDRDGYSAKKGGAKSFEK